ncbi:MAG: outer membrane beta-barrel protein [Vulcanimicrobiota bacterium]
MNIQKNPVPQALLRVLTCIVICCIAAAVSTFPAWSQDQKEVKTGETEQVKKQSPAINVYLQGLYEVNTNNPSSGLNDFRPFDYRSIFIDPDLLEIRVNQDPDRGRLGYRVKVTAGETPRLLHSRGLGTYDDRHDFMEFFLAYKFPIGRGLKVEAGKMGTVIGAESLEAVLNQNYTRSFLWSYAEPSTHTGLRLTYDLSSQVSLIGHINNGWDNFSDNDAAKTLGLSLCYNPNDRVGVYFNVLNGPEPDDNTWSEDIANSYYNNRFIFDWVGSFRLSDRFLLLGNYDYAKQDNYLLDGSAATWSGFSLIGSYDFTDTFSLALRGEIFSDPQGYRTGVAQTLKELTLTPQFKVGKNVVIRPEFRYDWSDVKSFNDGSAYNQSTIGIGVMVTF